MANNNAQIAAQLQALASALLNMEDKELLPLILDACGGLMREVGARRPEVSKMTPVDLAGYTTGYTAISTLVGQFAEELHGADPVATTEEQLTDAMAELEALRREAAEKEAERITLESQIQAQQTTNDALDAVVQTKKDDLARLEGFHKTLLEMDQACSPQVIAKQQQDNANLLATVNQHNTALETLRNKKGELDKDLNEIRQKITDIQKIIDALPAEKTKLVSDYDAKEKELVRLQNAEVECSEEKQQELAGRIAELEPVVEKLEKKMGKLRDHHNQLCGAKTELDRQEQVLESDLLRLLEESMGEMILLMDEHKEVLNVARQQADTYRASLSECVKLRQEYSQWLGSNRSLLDANLAALDRQESTCLKQTLDVRSQECLREQFRQVAQTLRETDRFLQKCAEAAQLDLRNIERLAGG